MHRRNRRFREPSNGTCAAELIDDLVGEGVHAQQFATIADTLQASVAAMDSNGIKEELQRRNMSQRDLALAIGMDENHLSKALAGKRQFKVTEMDAIRAELAPEPADADQLPIKSIPWLGDVPASSFQPQEQKGGRRMWATDPDLPPRAYGLTVKGDSMHTEILLGAEPIVIEGRVFSYHMRDVPRRSA
jgi:transcriptional regulator with XRE-family HTH domain